jgi:hypothetical protein
LAKAYEKQSPKFKAAAWRPVPNRLKAGDVRMVGVDRDDLDLSQTNEMVDSVKV